MKKVAQSLALILLLAMVLEKAARGPEGPYGPMGLPGAPGRDGVCDCSKQNITSELVLAVLKTHWPELEAEPVRDSSVLEIDWKEYKEST